MVHVRRLAGRALRFGHTGWLWRNAYLLYDTETDSVWHHQTGWALSGPLRGSALHRFPTVQTTFAAWVREHPGTRVLPKPGDDDRPLDRDVYAERNATLSFGLGLDLPDAFRLYPFAAVADAGGLVEDEVDGVPLVVAVDAPERGAYAYDRRLGDDVLRLELDGSPDGPLLRERGGTRAWRLRSGRPVAGTGAEGALRPLLASPWESGAWSAQHPAGTTWRRPLGDAPVPGGGR